MEITVIKGVEGGYIVMSDNGDTAFINQQTFEKLVKQNKIKNYA